MLVKMPRTERNFVDSTISMISEHFQSFGDVQKLQRELGIGRNIADVVALIATQGAPPEFPKRLSITECVVLATLRQHGPTRIDILEKLCGAAPRNFRNGEIERLVKSRLIQLGKGGRISLSADSTQGALVCAIEAKLMKWKDALKQAIEYTRYADLSYVLLPSEFATPAIENAKYFIESGVGLWHASATKLVEVVPAKQHQHHCWRREYALSRLFAYDAAPRKYECADSAT